MRAGKNGIVVLLLSAVMLTGAACGRVLSPLQSPVTAMPTPTPTAVIAPSDTATTAPTVVPSAVPPATGTATQTPTPTLSPTPGPSPTPDTRQTSESVIATITALAATPTYPPTSTPRPYRTPIGAGPAQTPRSTVIGEMTLQMISQQVIPGGAAVLTVKARPADVCTLRIDRSVPGATREEPIPGTATHTAGSDGVVAWIWTVDKAEPAGIMSLVIDCTMAGRAVVKMTVTR